MKKVWKAIIYFLAIILGIAFVLYGVNQVCIRVLAPKDSKISISVMERDIKKILNQYHIYGTIDFYENGELGSATFERQNPGRNGEVIYIDTFSKSFMDFKRYTEIEALIEIWLYLYERQLPFPIDGISYYFMQGGTFTHSAETKMSWLEFETLYREVEEKNITEEERIKKLTLAYIEQTGYTRSPETKKVIDDWKQYYK